MLQPSTRPSTMHEGFRCSTSFPILDTDSFLNIRQSSGYKVIAHFDFNLYFTNDYDTEHHIPSFMKYLLKYLAQLQYSQYKTPRILKKELKGLFQFK